MKIWNPQISFIIDHDLYNSIFSQSDPDTIAEMIMLLMNNLVNTLAPAKKIQIHRDNIFIPQRTKELCKNTKHLTKRFNETLNPHDYRLLCHVKNRLSKSIKDYKKVETTKITLRAMFGRGQTNLSMKKIYIVLKSRIVFYKP